MKVVVQKFGGRCVESEENQLITAERIMEARDRGLHPVVVVSAMGREGQPYSTVELVKTVRRIDPQIHPRELDLLMSCGEIISTVAMASLLRTQGYDTIAFSGGQAGLITDGVFGHARIVEIRPEPVLRALEEGQIVFVAGFQGNTTDHQITTLGAGGSDYTAVALSWIIQETPQLPFGDKLEVVPLQIFKEVDGVMTANPKSLEDGVYPRGIPELTYDECVWMSRLGAEVLQQQAAEMARQHGIPMVVRNYRNPEAEGTVVGASESRAGEGRATAIADQAQLVIFDLKDATPRLALQIAERLEKERLTYFQVSTETAAARFAVRPLKYREVRAVIERVLGARGVQAEIDIGRFALVSVVGESLRGRLETWTEEVEGILKKSGIEVHGTSSSEISLSCLVPEAQRKKAVSALHQHLVG